jgi:hypothetical protein
MTIPAAQFIETAVQTQAAEDPKVTAAKTHELHEARGEKDPQFIAGYLLGIQTAAVLLSELGIEL